MKHSQLPPPQNKLKHPNINRGTYVPATEPASVCRGKAVCGEAAACRGPRGDLRARGRMRQSRVMSRFAAYNLVKIKMNAKHIHCAHSDKLR